jgi:tetratricopeptide (TPR) repeat protein
LGEAEPLLREIADMVEGFENPPEELFTSQLHRVQAMSALSQGRLDEAEEYIQISLGIGERLSRESARACQDVASAYEGTERKIQPGSMCYPIRSYVDALRVAADIADARGNQDAAEGFLKTALEWAAKTGSQETVYNISLGYARKMEEKGDLEPAMEYYKAAAAANLPLKRKQVGRASFVG